MNSLREMLLRWSTIADGSIGTWFFPAAIVVIGLGALIAALLIPPGISNLLNFSVLRPNEGLEPGVSLRWWSRFWFGLSLISALSFWLVVHKMSDDVKSQSENNKMSANPPAVISAAAEDEPKSKRQKGIDYYVSQGFAETAKFESEDGRETLLLSKSKQDSDNFWRRKGVLIYPDGYGLPFTVGILHSGDSWSYKSEYLVKRQNIGKPVRIATALRRPLIKQLADEHDYLLTIGLASTRDGSGDPDFNDNLSGARAYNAAYAAWKLQLKSIDRIRWIHLGYAKSNAKTKEYEALQRSVVLIGMVAEKEIYGRDVVIGATKLITLDGVNLSNYSIPITALVPQRQIKPESDYRSAKNFFRGTKQLEPLILPPVDDGDEPNIK